MVWHGVGDIRVDAVADPKIEQPNDAIVRLTSSALCGTDLHFVRGTMTGMREGTVLGHEGVGVVEEVGPGVRNLSPGDRVVIPSTIGCGYCSYCRAGYYAQCDVANPNGKDAGTALFGGPASTGPFDGLQAELARVLWANVGCVKLPDALTDDQAIMVSDIFPTGWFGARLADVGPGDIVAVFGCGPVGQFVIASAKHLGAGRVLAVDGVESRLAAARAQGAEVIDFNAEDPVETLHEITGGIGPDRVVDAVGVDAQRPKSGPAAGAAAEQAAQFDSERAQVAPDARPSGDTWVPGDAPSQVSQWAVEAVAKAGTVGVVGVYPPTVTSFPFGPAMMKNLSIKMRNCNHRKYLPHLLDLVVSGAVEPAKVITQQTGLVSAVDAYQTFDRREPGWLKVTLDPAA